MNSVRERADKARQAARILAASPSESRGKALEAVSLAMEERRPSILAANELDMAVARELVETGELSTPLLNRLDISGNKLDSVISMIHSIVAQPEPLENTSMATELDEGLNLFRVSVPIGVIGVIFESRPDALVQIACLCLKSGNAIVLKGGREAEHTNKILAEIITEATSKIKEIPPGWLVLLTERQEVNSLLDEHESIDLIIPRGGNELVQYIMRNTQIPVMGHADGICHVYIDVDADLDKALRIIVDSKTQYVSVCNAAETLLIHSDIVERLLLRVVDALEEKNVELRADERAFALYPDRLVLANDEDWITEYLDYVLSIRVVDNCKEAIAHINRYGSHHTDSIVTENIKNSKTFLREVDSATVMHNASTRFADGFRYGLGAEVGISTNRLHSRGPVGLEGLTIHKYVVEGNGHIVESYEGKGTKKFTHRKLEDCWEPRSK
ncbi:MAG: glutamate-5-semialdehyde dehydrogenase [Candidatus Latescibacterota bacterium]|nr:glutamate-5-semialdehyde dehydrogenase [Candidatus Latescibacterota bacterium]